MDRIKRKHDKKENSRKCMVASFANRQQLLKVWETKKWRQLRPGDIIQLKKGDYVPADCVILDTSLIVNKDCWAVIDTSLVNGRTEYV